MNSQINRYIGPGMEKGHRVSMPSLGAPPSQHLYVFTSLEAHQFSLSEVFIDI